MNEITIIIIIITYSVSQQKDEKKEDMIDRKTSDKRKKIEMSLKGTNKSNFQNQ
jgi:hypothetical protein